MQLIDECRYFNLIGFHFIFYQPIFGAKKNLGTPGPNREDSGPSEIAVNSYVGVAIIQRVNAMTTTTMMLIFSAAVVGNRPAEFHRVFSRTTCYACTKTVVDESAAATKTNNSFIETATITRAQKSITARPRGGSRGLAEKFVIRRRLARISSDIK